MPRKSASPVICTQCGATLQPEQQRGYVTCQYCDATFDLSRARAMAHQRAGGPGPSRTVVVVAIAGGVLTLGVAMLASLTLRSGASDSTPQVAAPTAAPPAHSELATTPTPVPAAKPAATAFLSSPRPFVRDVDGDEIEDLLGWLQRYDDGAVQVYLIALNGTDQSELWRSDSLGELSNMAGKLRVMSTPGRLLVSVGASLSAYDDRTGQRQWTTNLSDQLDALATEEGRLRAKTIDDRFAFIDLKDGALTRDQSKRPIKFKLRGADGYATIAEYKRVDLDSGAWSGLYVERSYCPDHLKSRVSPKGKELRWGAQTLFMAYCYNDFGVAYAYRSKGSHIPFLIGYSRKDRRTQAWKRQLTPPGSIARLVDDPEIEIRDGRALACYERERGTYTVELFDVQSGEVAWTQTIEGETWDRGCQGGVLGAQRAYIHTGARLLIYDVEQGTLLATLRER